MTPYMAELVGTFVLVMLVDGVVANVALARSKGHNAGWMVVTTACGLAVTIALYLVGRVSGHLNPAVTLASAASGNLAWSLVPGYIAAQMTGGFLAGVAVWLAYLPHWEKTPDPAVKLGVFCTAPAIRHTPANLINEILGTFVLVLAILGIFSPANLTPNSDLHRGIGPCLVGLVVWSIGLSLGGPTGFAINPARDFGPRLAHAILPIPGKGGNDWGYAWIPIVGPILGGLAGAFCYQSLFGRS